MFLFNLFFVLSSPGGPNFLSTEWTEIVDVYHSSPGAGTAGGLQQNCLGTTMGREALGVTVGKVLQLSHPPSLRGHLKFTAVKPVTWGNSLYIRTARHSGKLCRA